MVEDALANIPLVNVLTPPKVWSSAVTSPRAVAEADGQLNVCVVPEETIEKGDLFLKAENSYTTKLIELDYAAGRSKMERFGDHIVIRKEIETW